ncbi:MAG TPA: ethanolamine ammonia-lyase reactivating factor EutA [Propioniciclava tarda]|nr:ethanolamine ammonia-lyase reactivating factor EutA [Propioniciclava tarda]
MPARELLSVGIDVGTTTTQLVASRLTVTNRARMGLVPRLDVDAREVLYQSPTHSTPLTSPDEVDVNRLVALVRGDYAAAGITPDQVETGAVIVTGETARTRNAEAILQGLAELAGDFVVTVAGPNLESQIAGRGSGAAEWSRQHYATVVTVDIGGGSSNAAVFRSGRHAASAASMVGGRQLTLDADGRVTHIAPSGVAIIADLGIHGLAVGQTATAASLRRLTDAMADIIVDLVLGIETPLGKKVGLTPPLHLTGPTTAYFLSGGVGRAFYDHDPADTFAEIARYGDVGPLLARSLRENDRLKTLRVERPAQTLHATVLGAASQQVTLSGSTIWAEDSQLPLKNVPVVEPHLGDVVPTFDDSGRLQEAIAKAVARWDRSEGGEWQGCAIALDLPKDLAFGQVQALASALVAFARQRIPRGKPLILVSEQDYAQVLGQTIKGLADDLPVVVVDQIGLGEGDFIDIGVPLFDGRVVPVSVKTLVFYQ